MKLTSGLAIQREMQARLPGQSLQTFFATEDTEDTEFRFL